MLKLASEGSFYSWQDIPLRKDWFRFYHVLHRIEFFQSQCAAIWRKVNGYHFGAMCCAWTTGVVLIINIVSTVWGSARFGVQGGLGTIQNGSCTTTKNLGFWLHLIINVLSTLLLGASNYSMQCLSSPTRAEIDNAHRQHVWLDIGVPSVRNLKRISYSRIVLWWLLAASSIPLHLFYNSAIFSSLYSRSYNVFVVSSDFPAEESFNFTVSPDSYTGAFSNATIDEFEQLRLNALSLERLENRACLEAYAGEDLKLSQNSFRFTAQLSTKDSFLGAFPNQPAILSKL